MLVMAGEDDHGIDIRIIAELSSSDADAYPNPNFWAACVALNPEAVAIPDNSTHLFFL